MTDGIERIMKLGETDGFRYIGVKPPLSQEELNALPLPTTQFSGENLEWRPTSVETLDDGTMDIGFDSTPFDYGSEDFETYASRVSKHLGNCTLETTVHIIGPGGVIAQASGTPARW